MIVTHNASARSARSRPPPSLPTMATKTRATSDADRQHSALQGGIVSSAEHVHAAPNWFVRWSAGRIRHETTETERERAPRMPFFAAGAVRPRRAMAHCPRPPPATTSLSSGAESGLARSSGRRESGGGDKNYGLARSIASRRRRRGHRCPVNRLLSDVAAQHRFRRVLVVAFHRFTAPRLAGWHAASPGDSKAQFMCLVYHYACASLFWSNRGAPSSCSAVWQNSLTTAFSTKRNLRCLTIN